LLLLAGLSGWALPASTFQLLDDQVVEGAKPAGKDQCDSPSVIGFIFEFRDPDRVDVKINEQDRNQ
jgi:hypothetical protein